MLERMPGRRRLLLSRLRPSVDKSLLLLPKPHRYIFFGGVLGWAITGMVQAWFWAGLALHPEGLDPATARTIFDIPAY